MNTRRRAGRRIALALLSIYLVFTLAFGFVALTPDPNVGQVRFSAGMSCTGTPEERTECIEERISAYRQANNLDEPVVERYGRWLVAMVTLDWGVSENTGASVLGSIKFTAPLTLAYVVPSMLLSAAGGLAAGTYLALQGDERLDRVGTALTYLGHGLPNFWLAAFLLLIVSRSYRLPGGYLLSWDPTVQFGASVFDPGTLTRMVLPVAVLSTTLFASQMRYARGETLEQAGSELVKVVRAKGFGDRGVARHVIRLAAPLLVSLFVVDLFGVIVVNIFVIEYVFELRGFGMLTYDAITNRDMPMLLGTTMVIAIAGIVGNALKDLATLALDPRVGDSER